MLKARYPEFFARIPDQSTGVPVLTPRWRFNAVRAGRFACRIIQRTANRIGVPMAPRQRAYHDDERVWSEVSTRGRIESVILRRDSLCCEVFGRQAVADVVKQWFERGEGPAQIVGALYVFELYHRDLPASLRAVKRAAEGTVSLVET
jgi:hypothetical protein